jgi:RNA polymerase sigma-70 factor (sigma-E family)
MHRPVPATREDRPNVPMKPKDAVFSDLFSSEYERLVRLAYGMLGEMPTAEEVVMEAFTSVFAKWSNIRKPERIDVYLRRSVINQSRSTIRRLYAERKANSKHAVTGEATSLEPQSELLDVVLRLPWRQRSCVLLRYYEDLTEREIGEILDCSIGTVKTHLSRARRSLEVTLREDQKAGRGRDFE